MNFLTKLKSITLKITIITFIVLIVLTIFSSTVNKLLLPVVNSVTITGGNINYVNTFTGNFEMVKKQTQIISTDSWNISEVFVANGQKIIKGDKLFRINTSSYQLQLYQLDTQIQEKTNNLNAIAWTGGDKLVKEREIEALKLEASQIRTLFPPNGIIYAEQNGTIKFNENTRAVTAHSIIAVIEDEAAFNLSIEVAPEDILSIMKASSIEYTFKHALNMGASENKTFNLTFANQEYNKATKKYTVQFDVSESKFNSNDMIDGLPFEIKVKSQSETFQALVPNSCIGTDANNDNFVYVIQTRNSIWGNESYLQKRKVEILQSNNELAAIQENDLNGLIVCMNPSKAVHDGDAVKVL